MKELINLTDDHHNYVYATLVGSCERKTEKSSGLNTNSRQ